jgi:glycosyltransferase involved in cell wall biosynthesis
MIRGRTILCFASGYDAPPTSKHHVMHLLAEHNTVLWVNYHASRMPSASTSDLLHIRRKLAQVFAGIKSPRKNLHVLTPLVVPLPGSAWARKLNRRLMLHQIRRALRRIRSGPVQLWSFTPDVSYLLGQFGEETVLYYCVDDHASFTGYDREQVLRDEEDLCRRANLVVTTSMKLQNGKQPFNPNTILVSHGVDYEHFSKAVSDHLPTPADIAAIPRPRLGFFGLIRDWVDLDLLAAVARRRPDWHFVLIGDSTIDLAPYRELANMHFLGRKPYAELPAYCKEFDVGLVPFKINELTNAVNPIKLREYLAAGLPVVSTPLPEVKACGRLVKIADGPDAFAELIEAELPVVSGDAGVLTGMARAGRQKQAAARSQNMMSETWPAKVDEICRLLSSDAAVKCADS